MGKRTEYVDKKKAKDVDKRSAHAGNRTRQADKRASHVGKKAKDDVDKRPIGKKKNVTKRLNF